MSSNLPHRMTPDQIVAEIGEHREAISVIAQRITDLSRGLHTQMRRTASSGTTPAYIAYSNAWMRFAGAVNQGIRRTVQVDRVLDRYKAAGEDAARHAEREKKKEAAKKVEAEAVERSEREAEAAKVVEPNLDAARQAAFGDLIELYGEEMVRNAY